MPSDLSRLGTDTKGNVAIIFALAMFPMIGVVGMSIDYTLAGRRQAHLNTIADAAALMTTSPSGMALSQSAAQAAAVKMFNAQAGLMGNVGAPTPAIAVTDTPDSTGTVIRTTSVSYTATSQNAFSALLRMNTMNIGGVAKVSGSTAPNIDFYLLLDTSPSMGIPSSQDGINTMVNNTRQQGGCAFACHETNPAWSDVVGNPTDPTTGKTMDNYALSRKLGLTLRIDLVQQATANLYQTAATTQAKNKAVYRVATYTFDQSFQTITNLTANLAQAQSDAINKVQMLQVYSENQLTSTNNNNDQDTLYDSAMANSAYIPNPGKGTNAAGDTPQEVIFIITDGVLDEPYPNVGPTDYTTNGRTIAPMGHQYDYCTPLKNRGIRIAILYTTYNPLPTNGFYNQYIAPFQPSISDALSKCASSGLFTIVNTGGDINTAMQGLFKNAVGSAHLTQ